MTDYTYGLDVIEFFKHSDAEFQQMLTQRTVQYYRHSESPAYPQLGAHVDWFSDRPLTHALNDMLEWTRKGYGIAAALHQPLYLKVQLKKPQKLIKSDLKVLEAQVRADYTKERFERNKAETSRQIGISINRQRREREAAQAAMLAQQHVDDEALALADLLRAYAEPGQAQTTYSEEAA